MEQPMTTLVELEQRHLPFLDSLWKDPKVTCYTGIPSGGIDVYAWYERYARTSNKHEGDTGHFMIYADDTPIGETAYGMLPREFIFGSWSKDVKRPCALADIKLATAHWGKGYATDAFMQLIDHVFTNTRAVDIIALPHEANERALRLYERCGLVSTGASNPYGMLVFTITKEMWNDG